jgi:asparagine synthase (glutamine-hydrolysing)
MCGIAGIVDWDRATSAGALADIGQAMNKTLHHRGPDAGDVWIDAEAGIALAHRRLAIIDLSAGGAQPKCSSDGRYVVVFNGEIYNYRDLRRELAALGRQFHTESDTEVLLEACAHWGVRGAVERCIGMFAFALWDRSERRLFLVRDRLGIKPLYFAQAGRRLLFASQSKAFHAVPGFAPKLDRSALSAYLRFGYVPAPLSIFAGVAQLEPGCIARIEASGSVQIERYWDASEAAHRGVTSRLDLDDGEAVAALDALLRDSVKLRMIADVPLGAFLSGGVDSSLVVSLMQAQSNRPVKTFGIGFRESGFDEAPFAAAVARHLGTEHHEIYVDPADVQAVIPNLPDWFDEPFADSSQIPTYLVSAAARRHVTVSLSGDGGDELFAGYSRYTIGRSFAGAFGRIPGPMRRLAACGLTSLSAATWDHLAGALPGRLRLKQAGYRAHKIAAMLGRDDPVALYRDIMSQWLDPERLALGSHEPAAARWSVPGEIADGVERLQLVDLTTYLPHDVLTKVDRASMAVGLEARVPILDHRVVEFSWRLPPRFKLRDGRPKWLLRQVLDRYVPRPLVERPKMGFTVPIGDWLRGPLREWAETLLAPARLEAAGCLDPALVGESWQAHLSGRRNEDTRLWSILMFEAWRERYRISG